LRKAGWQTKDGAIKGPTTLEAVRAQVSTQRLAFLHITDMSRLLPQNTKKSKNACAMQHHEEEAVAEVEVVHPSVEVMPVTFPVGERCLRQTTGGLASTTSEDCRIATSHVKRLRNRRPPLDQAQCSRVLEDLILESHYLVNRARIQVHQAGQAHRQLRRRRKTKKTRKLRRTLSGESDPAEIFEEDINAILVLLQALILESLPIPLLLQLRLQLRSSSQRSANDRSRLLGKTRKKAREQHHEPLASQSFTHTVPSASKVAAIYHAHPPGPHPLRVRSHMKHAYLFN